MIQTQRQGLRAIRGALAMIVGLAGWAHAAAAEQVFPLTDTNALVARNVDVAAVDYQGRKAVRIIRAQNVNGFALLSGTDFQDGAIEADVAVKMTGPPGARMPGFIGIAFRARPDASHYDLFYLRPGNARVGDQAMRNHALQYTAAPDYGWYRLRREWPSVYEAHVDLQVETWMHLKIEVKGRSGAIFINGSTQPSLIVDGLKGEDLRGAVALVGGAGQEAYFSNVRITNAPAQAVTNGGEATGSWQVKLDTDVDPFEGTLQLRRENSTLTGTWSGAFGTDRPVTGTWRNGYVELTFAGEWPETLMGKPGPAAATLAGWIDGASAKGRVRVEGRADGSWTATRTR